MIKDCLWRLVMVALLILGVSSFTFAKVKVVYWEKWTGMEAIPIEIVIDEFNKSQNEIEVEYVPVSDLDTKILTAIASGNVPDLTGGRMSVMVELASQGQLIPLDEFMKDAGLKDEDFWPIVNNEGTYNGKRYGMAITALAWIMYYNKGIFAEYGLSPDDPPRSMEELNMVAKKLTRVNSDGNLEQIGFSLVEPGMSWDSWRWIRWFDGKLWDEENNEFVLDPKAVKAYEWAESWTRYYGLGELQTFESTFGGWGTPKVPFFTGKTAITYMGPWMDMHLQTYAPDLEFGAAPWPAVKERERRGPTAYFNADVCYIPKGSKYPKEAFEFLKFVVSPEGQTLMNCGEYPNVNGRQPVVRNYGGEDFIAANPNRFIRQHLEVMDSPNIFSGLKIPGVSTAFVRETDYVYKQAMGLEGSPEENLERALAEIQRKLDRYLR